MDPYPKPLRLLVNQLKRLPGIGEKTATRLALYILGDKATMLPGIIDALEGIKLISLCPVCFNLTDKPKCVICSEQTRDASIICVVEEPGDILAIESSHEYKGVYHVLHGLVSPINGIGPDDIRIKDLIGRLRNNPVKEIVIALSPSVEGDGTSHYLQKIISTQLPDLHISRIASGIPMGGELKYMDHVTLASAMRYRRTI